MKKWLLGTLLGGFLGIFDGLTAPLSAPETAPQLLEIVVGSLFKGFITGWLIGYFAQKVQSLALGITFGLIVGSALSFVVALLQYLGPDHKNYFWQIMLPGAILGIIVGYVTQTYGKPAAGHIQPTNGRT